MSVACFLFEVKIVRSFVCLMKMSINTAGVLAYARMNTWAKVGAISLSSRYKTRDSYKNRCT